MKTVIGLDPGSKKSAIIHWDGKTILDKGILSNEEILDLLDAMWYGIKEPIVLAIESMISISGGGGKAICDTIRWEGRFYQKWNGEREFVPAGTVRMALCATMRSGDPDVMRVLIQRFGEPGTQKKPGLTYGLQAHGYHLWRAFGLAVTWFDHLEFQRRILT